MVSRWTPLMLYLCAVFLCAVNASDNDNAPETPDLFQRILSADDQDSFMVDLQSRSQEELAAMVYEGNLDVSEHFKELLADEEEGELKIHNVGGARLVSPNLLHLAALRDFDLVCHMLLVAGVPVDARTHLRGAMSFDDLSPLHIAAMVNGIGATEMLLEEGKVDPNLQADGISAVRFAADSLAVAAMHTLLSHDADPMVHPVSDIPAADAIHLCAVKGDQECLETLLAFGVDPDEQAYGGVGDTALHAAAMAGHTNLVEFMLDEGFRTEIKSKDGLYPLDLAQQQGHTDIVDLLRKEREQLQEGGFESYEKMDAMRPQLTEEMLAEARAAIAAMRAKEEL